MKPSPSFSANGAATRNPRDSIPARISGRYGFTADASADIDGNGTDQFWGYKKPDGGSDVGAQVGCDEAYLNDETVGPCDSSFGQSEF